MAIDVVAAVVMKGLSSIDVSSRDEDTYNDGVETESIGGRISSSEGGLTVLLLFKRSSGGRTAMGDRRSSEVVRFVSNESN